MTLPTPRVGMADVGFHTGVITAWDPQTGANTVLVSGESIDDIPTLNLTETLTLRAGVNVGVLRFRHSYFILGRITSPNSPDFFSGAMPDLPAAFYNVNTDDVLQSNTIGSYFAKLVGGYVVNHRLVNFGVRSQVSGGGATGAWRVQWYVAHPGNGANPAGGTLMASRTGIASPGTISANETYEWPVGMRGSLVYISYEVNLTAGVGGTDWVSAVPTLFVGRDSTIT